MIEIVHLVSAPDYPDAPPYVFAEYDDAYRYAATFSETPGPEVVSVPVLDRALAVELAEGR